jgi:hypothetical protein
MVWYDVNEDNEVILSPANWIRLPVINDEIEEIE